LKKYFRFILLFLVLVLAALACTFSGPGTDPSTDQTMVALAIQQTSLALQQADSGPDSAPVNPPESQAQATYTPYPTFTQPVPEPPTAEPPSQEEPQQAPPTSTATITLTATLDILFQRVTVDRTIFYCISGDGPTELTITVEMSDVDRGATLFWRLEQKSNNTTTDWEIVDMRRAGGNTRSYTFDADVWAGTNNFYYPPLMGESWFEYQIISNDGLDRTEVFTNVTFFPCAQ
jgi:hypothetical protein